VDVREHASADSGPPHKVSFHTHVVIEEDGDLVLKRRAFDCGFD